MEKELCIIVNRKDENTANITSNFQDDLNLLETEEVIPVILDLLNCLMEKIRKNEIEQEKANKEISEYMGNLFYEIINFVNNKIGGNSKNFDYSLAVYETNEDNNSKEVYETFHYGDLQNHEKLLSCYAFYKDIADELLERYSKKYVKALLGQVFSIMLDNIYRYVEKYNLPNTN